MGFGGAQQQVPSPWGEKQFKQVRCFALYATFVSQLYV